MIDIYKYSLKNSTSEYLFDLYILRSKKLDAKQNQMVILNIFNQFKKYKIPESGNLNLD